MEEYLHVKQPSLEELKQGYVLKGKWKQDFFQNQNPIVLELGCGKGEYAFSLAKKYPKKNFIGIAHDTGAAIKGPSRIDLFTGFGHEAEMLASGLNNKISINKLKSKTK